MGLILSILLSALAVMAGAYLLPGVTVDGYGTAIVVAIVLAILNAILRPILVILTIPVTILTLGLFLLVINVIIIYIADALIGGFEVAGFLSALLFSIILALLNALIGTFVD
ncbi:putative membrane protein [Catalinimonas alkaloidigena]|uniref:Putative membrane protein n=1 Tax=Catalinimonas alkaloidigena TaxID=1075417 RepID=A0A1G9SHM9_9BACT|nr:phage holin family protein [Catalinimonas alkaloidigena]SDM34911.1 putative membrane protein [Catalinimonas alkaloidigena]